MVDAVWMSREWREVGKDVIEKGRRGKVITMGCV